LHTKRSKEDDQKMHTLVWWRAWNEHEMREPIHRVGRERKNGGEETGVDSRAIYREKKSFEEFNDACIFCYGIFVRNPRLESTQFCAPPHGCIRWFISDSFWDLTMQRLNC
jgi:hypothetical protein